MGLGGYCDSDSVPTSCRDGPWKVRADEAVLPDRAGSPAAPLKGKGGRRSSFSLMKGWCPQPLVRAVPAWLVSVDNGSRRLSCKVSHHPQQPAQGPLPPLQPHPLSQQSHPGAKELKKGRLESTAGRELSPGLPGAGPAPLQGSRTLNTHIVYR